MAYLGLLFTQASVLLQILYTRPACSNQWKTQSLRSGEPSVQLAVTGHAGPAERAHRDQCQQPWHASAMCSGGTCSHGNLAALCVLKTFGQLALPPEHTGLVIHNDII